MTHDAAVEPLVDLARMLHAQGEPLGSVEAFQQALALAPQRADLHADLGNVWQELYDHEAALACYRQAIAVDPNCLAARQNLGYLLLNLGEPEQALAHYEYALSVRPTPMSRMLAATVLPVIYDSAEELTAWRRRFRSQVRDLADGGLRVDTLSSQIPTNFLLAYQGENDRQIASDLGRIYQRYELRPVAGTAQLARRSDGRLRIGFLSAYFCDHTIGRLNLGRVRQLSRARFHVTVLAVGQAHDEIAQAFVRAADRFVPLPRHVETVRQMIAEQDLDVLIFTDVGMDAITSTLAYSRMAPVQCVTWGHPNTTGSPTIDYYLSSELAEVADAEAHYTERLVRLPLLGVYYYRPTCLSPRRTRSFFGLDERRHIYLCPQTLYKFHPEFDAVLAGLLTADPQGDLILLDGRVRNWTERLRRRFSRTITDADRRVRFLPPQSYDEFLGLIEVADVLLDPTHFGGGNSSYEALALGTPVVTFPGQFLRGRLTQALYRKMGFTDLIADSPEAYISLAVKLANDKDFCIRIGDRIRATSHVLFEDPQEVAVLDDFLWSLSASHHS